MVFIDWTQTTITFASYEWNEKFTYLLTFFAITLRVVVVMIYFLLPSAFIIICDLFTLLYFKQARIHLWLITFSYLLAIKCFQWSNIWSLHILWIFINDESKSVCKLLSCCEFNCLLCIVLFFITRAHTYKSHWIPACNLRGNHSWQNTLIRMHK